MLDTNIRGPCNCDDISIKFVREEGISLIEKFVSLLMMVSTLISNVFGCNIPGIPDCSVYTEDKPEIPLYRVCDEVHGAGNSVFNILRPNAGVLYTVYAADFGFLSSNNDNYAAFAGIVDYCKQNPRTRVVFEKGDYFFNTDAGFGLSGLTDIYFEGNGTLFIFSYGSSYFSLSGCECVEFNNITVDWNWERSRLGSIVRVENADAQNHALDLVFTELADVSENVVFSAITQYDPETLTPGAKESSKEAYLYQIPGAIAGVEKVASNVLRVTHNGILDNFLNGEVYLLRHYVYGSAVFYLYNNSENITFDGVNIFGAAGMGFVVAGGANHFQFLNTTVGLNPTFAATRRVSVTADALHIADSDGCFRVENCDFSFMGDDGVNIHDNLGCVSGVTGSKTLLVQGWMAAAILPGDVLAFKNSDFETLDFTSAVVSVSPAGGGLFTVTLSDILPETVQKGGMLFNTAHFSGNYVIRGSRFHENRARGLLLQSGNGLCENNTFYKIMGNAIRIIMDVSPGYWQEGTGVNNLVIRNNTFNMCSYSNWGAVIFIGTSIAGKTAKTYGAFTNIEISGNTFKDSPVSILDANNISGLLFSGNTVSNDMEYSENRDRGRLNFGFYCSSVNLKNNTWSKSKYMFLPEVPKFVNPAMFDVSYNH